MNKFVMIAIPALTALAAAGAGPVEIPASRPSMILETGHYRFGDPLGGDAEISCRRFDKVSVVSQAPWLDASLVGNSLRLSADANPYVGERTGTVKIISSGGATTTMTVTQPSDPLTAEAETPGSGNSAAIEADLGVFTDGLCTALKPDIDAARIGVMRTPFLRELAGRILRGEYSAEGRTSSCEPLNSVGYLSELWNTPGKQYSCYQGATGVLLNRGKYVVFVDGLPEHKPTIALDIVGWTVEDKGTFANTFKTESFELHNGLNVIERTTDWAGLAYVTNFDDRGLADGTASTVRTHFVGVPVNGVLTPYMTNEEIQRVLDNAQYTTIDLLGQRVQSVWEVQALKTYTAGQYVRYMNLLDLLIYWEHKLIGFEKYDRVPRNKTLAYVNYDYYMYQGWAGVTFKYDTQARVCNPDRIMYSDDDVVWGLSHEWGHQHQMHPYFTWTGMSEVTNNMNSYYNIMHMGYERGEGNNANAIANFLRDRDYKSGDHESAYRSDAYSKASRYAWNEGFHALCLANEDPRVAPVAENPLRAVHHSEDGVGSALSAFTLLYCWATTVLGLEDFGPDMYESLRQTDAEGGSSIEKHSGLDKYELLAAGQNYNKGGACKRFREAYPESVWTTRGYLSAAHCNSFYDNGTPFVLNYIRKVSRLTGYNLVPYFEQWGFLRTVALYINDYGDKWLLLPEDAYREFIADMDALVASGELKAMPEGMVEEICATPELNMTGGRHLFATPSVPNDAPIDLRAY